MAILKKETKKEKTKETKKTEGSGGMNELKAQISILREELFQLKLEHAQRKLKQKNNFFFRIL